MRFFLADGNSDVRAALRLALEQHTGWQVIGEAADTIHLLAYAARDCPDVIILDPNLPGIRVGRQLGSDSLAELVTLLRWICPEMRLISLGSRPEEQKDYALTQFDLYALKNDPPDQFLKWVEVIGAGK